MTKSLWTHLVFINAKQRRVGRKIIMTRIPIIVNGLFNQLYALFVAVDLTKILGRDHLVVGNFYVNINDKTHFVPLSRVIQLGSLLVYTTDWIVNKEPVASSLLKHPIAHPPNSIQILQKHNHIIDLEVGCCFTLLLHGHTMDQHVRKMRFHPFFYQLVAPFLRTYPKYQVVHYRMENDFTEYFFKKWHFDTIQECRENLFQLYNNTLKEKFDPNTPTLVVSHYYKDPNQTRDHDLQWDNLIHFNLNHQQKAQLCQHLQLPTTIQMREIDAIIDFILCCTPNVSAFIGCGCSTFSGSVCMYYNNQNCSLVHPIKNI